MKIEEMGIEILEGKLYSFLQNDYSKKKKKKYEKGS